MKQNLVLLCGSHRLVHRRITGDTRHIAFAECRQFLKSLSQDRRKILSLSCADSPSYSIINEFSLIVPRPVGLKEAALDSPTFRSGFTHFSEQLDYLEKWLENYVRSITKLSHEIGTFEGLINGFLTAVSSPPNVSEAVVDHDYTLLAMKRYSEGARDFWATTISSLKKMDVNMIEPIRAFLQNDFRTFKVRHCTV